MCVNLVLLLYQVLSRQRSGTMFAMASSDTPYTSRRSLMLFHIDGRGPSREAPSGIALR